MSRRGPRDRAAVVAASALVLAGALLGQRWVDGGGATSPGSLPSEAEVERALAGARAGTALEHLAQLPVRGRAPRTGFDRDRFGDAWADVDRNGCDTRNDVLARDLTEVVLRGGSDCVVVAGTLAEPYAPSTIAFVRGQDSSDDVQVDHVVALSDAWQKGAQQWPPEVREAFANDPLNLLAVDGPLNGQKSDSDAATWLPPNRDYRCRYVARQVAVKFDYGLWVTPAERAAVVAVLDRCPDEPLPR